MDVVNLQYFENLTAKTTVIHNISSLSLRENALHEVALQLGVQIGLHDAQAMIDKSLDQIASLLYQTYNFNALIMPWNLLPAVVEGGYNYSGIDNDQDTVNMTAKMYHMIKPAHFVSSVPTWKDYLARTFDKPQLPEDALLPVTEAEIQNWKKTIKDAYERGIEQAIDIYTQNLHQLNRDFNGMIVYYELIDRGMMLPAIIDKTYKTVSANQTNLMIDNSSWHISSRAQFQKDASRWKAIVKKQDNNTTNR